MNFKTMRTILFLSFSLLFLACSNDDRTFELKTIKLDEYAGKKSIPKQNIYLKVFSDDSDNYIAQTEVYPTILPLPATFKVYPSPEMNLYAKPYHIELWGEVTGFIGICNIDMDDYKIIFPIDMEVKSESLSISLQGSWK